MPVFRGGHGNGWLVLIVDLSPFILDIMRLKCPHWWPCCLIVRASSFIFNISYFLHNNRIITFQIPFRSFQLGFYYLPDVRKMKTVNICWLWHANTAFDTNWKKQKSWLKKIRFLGWVLLLQEAVYKAFESLFSFTIPGKDLSEVKTFLSLWSSTDI